MTPSNPSSSALERHGWLAGVAVLGAVIGWGLLSGAGMTQDARDRGGDEPVAAEERPQGRYRRARGADDAEDVEALAALGYLSGSREASDLVSVSIHERDRVSAGPNLYVSGHGNEAVLMDMDGATLHTWRLSVDEAFPAAARTPTARFWRRAWLLPEGDLLAIYEGVGMVRLDRDGAVRWKQANKAHHDLEVLPDGRIVTLVREVGDRPEVSDRRPVAEDAYVVLDAADGREVQRVSLLEAYRRSAFEDHWLPRARRGGDVFHTNAVEVLDGRLAAKDPAWAAGNVLLSMRNIGTIAVLDPAAGTIVWSRTGRPDTEGAPPVWARQHDPHLLDDGNLLVFDNGGERGTSRVVELDPAGEIAWSWDGPGDETMWTGCCGTAQRLPNGNTLVTESEAGRAFEVTADGTVVWRFDSPHRAADDPRLVATLFEVLRLPADLDLGWVRDAR